MRGNSAAALRPRAVLSIDLEAALRVVNVRADDAGNQRMETARQEGARLQSTQQQVKHHCMYAQHTAACSPVSASLRAAICRRATPAPRPSCPRWLPLHAAAVSRGCQLAVGDELAAAPTQRPRCPTLHCLQCCFEGVNVGQPRGAIGVHEKDAVAVRAQNAVLHSTPLAGVLQAGKVMQSSILATVTCGQHSPPSACAGVARCCRRTDPRTAAPLPPFRLCCRHRR